MTLLNVTDLDRIWIVNSMWENKFFKAWVKVGAALVWNLWENENWKKKILMKRKTKIIEYDGA